MRLGELLYHRKEFITIDDLTTYKRPRVQLHAQGIVLRDNVPGALIKTKMQQVCRAISLEGLLSGNGHSDCSHVLECARDYRRQAVWTASKGQA